MKVQLRGQSIRFRIDEAELERLLAGEVVGNVTGVGHGVVWRQGLRLGDEALPRLDASATDWVLWLPRPQVLDYVARLPCRDGVEFVLTPDGAEPLSVAFEVDVRDSMRARGTGRRRTRTQSAASPDPMLD